MQLLPVRGLDDLDLNPPRLMIEVDENLRCRRETAASPGCRPRRSEAGERAAFEIGAYRREAESRGEVDGWHCHDGLVVAREASERNAIHAVTVPFVELDVPAIEAHVSEPSVRRDARSEADTTAGRNGYRVRAERREGGTARGYRMPVSMSKSTIRMRLPKTRTRSGLIAVPIRAGVARTLHQPGARITR